MARIKANASWLTLLSCAVLLSGCAADVSMRPSATQVSIRGTAHGGQQPISGAAIALYAASTSGYGGSVQNLLQTPVTTDSSGQFTITGDYTCTAGQQMYLVATGGNTGSGTNVNSAIMAALGDCNQLSPSTSIIVNEVTTVASVFALAPFMSSANAVGTSPANVAGLTRAFASVRKLANVAAGTAPGDLLPAGAVAPTSEIYTLANLLAACINSAGDTGMGSPCHQVFSLVTPSGGTAPTDTIGAALGIAKNPTLNVAALFNMIPGSSPFQPNLAVAPSDWTLAVSYSASFNKPSTTAVDSGGNIWIANSGNNTVQILSQSGAPAISSPLSGNGLSAPVAAAIDASGNGWFANSTGSSLSAFTLAGSPVSGSPLMPNGLSQPRSLAFDSTGNIWIASAGNDTVLELSSAGTPVQQLSMATGPNAIAINPK